MKKKSICSLAVLAAVVGIMISTAARSEDAPSPPVPPSPQAKVMMMAHGTGSADIKVDGRVMMNGNGTLVVKTANKNRLHVTGFTSEKQEGDVYYYKGEGRIMVSGDVSVTLTGDVQRLMCGGKGTAVLKGKGNYQIKDKKGEWTEEGVSVDL